MQDSLGAHWWLQLPQLLVFEMMSVSHPSEPSALQSSKPMSQVSHSTLFGLQKAPGQQSVPLGQGVGAFTHCASAAHGPLVAQSVQTAVAQLPGPTPCVVQKSTQPWRASAHVSPPAQGASQRSTPLAQVQRSVDTGREHTGGAGSQMQLC